MADDPYAPPSAAQLKAAGYTVDEDFAPPSAAELRAAGYKPKKSKSGVPTLQVKSTPTPAADPLEPREETWRDYVPGKENWKDAAYGMVGGAASIPREMYRFAQSFDPTADPDSGSGAQVLPNLLPDDLSNRIDEGMERQPGAAIVGGMISPTGIYKGYQRGYARSAGPAVAPRAPQVRDIGWGSTQPGAQATGLAIRPPEPVAPPMAPRPSSRGPLALPERAGPSGTIPAPTYPRGPAWAREWLNEPLDAESYLAGQSPLSPETPNTPITPSAGGPVNRRAPRDPMGPEVPTLRNTKEDIQKQIREEITPRLTGGFGTAVTPDEMAAYRDQPIPKLGPEDPTAPWRGTTEDQTLRAYTRHLVAGGADSGMEAVLKTKELERMATGNAGMIRDLKAGKSFSAEELRQQPLTGKEKTPQWQAAKTREAAIDMALALGVKPDHMASIYSMFPQLAAEYPQTLFHGTGVQDLKKFEDQFLLTGEGSYAPGFHDEHGVRGHYLAANRRTAESYAGDVSENTGQSLKGKVYTVEGPNPKHLLQYGLPLSKQSDRVKTRIRYRMPEKLWAALTANYGASDETRASQLIAMLGDLANYEISNPARRDGAKQILHDFLRETYSQGLLDKWSPTQKVAAVFDKLGIPGMVYDSGYLGGTGGGNMGNRVIWNPTQLKIKNGEYVNPQAAKTFDPKRAGARPNVELSVEKTAGKWGKVEALQGGYHMNDYQPPVFNTTVQTSSGPRGKKLVTPDPLTEAKKEAKARAAAEKAAKAAQNAQAQAAGPVTPTTVPDILNPQTGLPLPQPPMGAGGAGGPPARPPGAGGPPVPPGGPLGPQAPTVPQWIAQRAMEVRARVDLLMSTKDPYKRNIISKALFAPGTWGHPDVKAYAREFAAAKALTEKWPDYYDALGGAKPPKGLDPKTGKPWTKEEWRKDVQAFGERTLKDADMLAKYGQGWVDRSAVYRDAIARIRESHLKLVAMGVVPHNPAFLDGEGYLARTYMAFADKHWLNRAPGQAIEHGAADIARLSAPPYAAAANPMTAEEIAADIVDRLGRGQSYMDMEKDGAKWTTAIQRLRKKNQKLPAGIREMLGEIDGPASLAITAAHQESLLKQFEILTEIAMSDEIFTHDPDQALRLGWKQVPMGNRAYGPLQGGYVRSDIAQVLDHTATAKAKAGLLFALQSIWKKNLIPLKFPVGVTHQTMREFLHATMSGGLDLTDPGRALTAMGKVEKAIRAYYGSAVTRTKANPFSDDANLVNLASRYGAWEQSQNRMEMRNTHLEMAREMARSVNFVRGRPLERVLDAMMRITAKGIKPHDKLSNTLGEAYQMPANYWRLLAFSDRFDYYQSTGLEVHPAARAAAQDVADAFTSTQNMSKMLDTARKFGAGILDPFIVDNVEELSRLPARWGQRMANDKNFRVKQAWNMAILGGAVTAFGAWARHHYNISDADEARAQSDLEASGKAYYHPATMLIGRDSRGHLVFLDYTWLHNALRMFQGDPEYTPGNLATNLLMSPIQGGFMEGPARQQLSNWTGIPPPPQFQTPEAHKSWETALYLANRAGLVGYAAIGGAIDYMNSLGYGLDSQHGGMFTTDRTPAEAATGLIGLGTSIPIGPKTGTGAKLGTAIKQTDLLRQAASEGRAGHKEGEDRARAAAEEQRLKREAINAAERKAPNAYRKVDDEK